MLEHGSARRRVQALRGITTLFLDGAGSYSEDHVRLFDEVFDLLIREIDPQARAELSHRLAPIGNAPTRVVCRLARDDAIEVARPVLQQSRRLADRDLREIAETKSQAHLLAISSRPRIAENLTGVLVCRGDRAVVHSLAENLSARLSDASFTVLLRRAADDAGLAETLGMRNDVPAGLSGDLHALAKPAGGAQIKSGCAPARRQVATSAAPRDFRAAQRIVAALQEEGALKEAQLIDFAKARRYEEVVAALAALCRVPIDVVDRLMGGERSDPILILCKSAGWSWPTARAILAARPPRGVDSRAELDAAAANFARLTGATAARVIAFWQMRPQGRQAGRSGPA